MKSIDEIFKIILGAKVWSFLDFKSAFWQIPIGEEDREKTAIICEKGLFHFNVVSFGVKNGSATIQRTCEKALDDCVGRNVEIHADNIEIFSKNMSSRVQDLREVSKGLIWILIKFKPCWIILHLKTRKNSNDFWVWRAGMQTLFPILQICQLLSVIYMSKINYGTGQINVKNLFRR